VGRSITSDWDETPIQHAAGIELASPTFFNWRPIVILDIIFNGGLGFAFGVSRGLSWSASGQ